MVYEVKCSECDKVIDFGGKEPDRLPADAIELNDEIYCKECVKKFVEFGIGDVIERIETLEENVKKIREELGLERTLEI
ncbi:MAG: hypothetical protein ABEJ83_01240 [Candidatus Nanohaloarchaea archaeon]